MTGSGDNCCFLGIGERVEHAYFLGALSWEEEQSAGSLGGEGPDNFCEHDYKGADS